MHPFESLSPESSVWIYQANRPLTKEEQSEIRLLVQAFVSGWVSHQVSLKAWGDVLYNRFVVLMADETYNQAGGCSIDESTRFIASIEQKFDISLFDRLSVAIQMPEGIISIHKDDLTERLQNGSIDPGTIMFNNLVSNKAAFESHWRIPIRDSWLAAII